jgi:hypothetical protein
MTHTALTADEEIRRIRALAAARKGHSVVADRHGGPPADRALSMPLASHDILAPAHARLTPLMRARACFVALTQRLGRPLGKAAIDNGFSATGSSLIK